MATLRKERFPAALGGTDSAIHFSLLAISCVLQQEQPRGASPASSHWQLWLSAHHSWLAAREGNSKFKIELCVQKCMGGLILILFYQKQHIANYATLPSRSHFSHIATLKVSTMQVICRFVTDKRLFFPLSFFLKYSFLDLHCSIRKENKERRTESTHPRQGLKENYGNNVLKGNYIVLFFHCRIRWQYSVFKAWLSFISLLSIMFKI